MNEKSDSSIFDRKNDHINLALEKNVARKGSNWLEYLRLVHNSLPELDFDEISLALHLFGKKIGAPILIDAITGGTSRAFEINSILAKISQKYNIPLCVGSQRVLTQSPSALASFRIVRDLAPSSLIFGNIGFSQLLKKSNFDEIESIVAAIEANALCVHLNPLQELIQLQGNKHFQNGIETLVSLQDILSIPLIIKEVGNGMSKEVIEQLQTRGITHFNIAGSGGTNFALIEADRAAAANNQVLSRAGQIYSEWGIPTAANLVEAMAVLKPDSLLIASGGIKSGLDIAKSLSLGANLCGIAYQFLHFAIQGLEQVDLYCQSLLYELKIAMTLTGTRQVQDLPKVPKIFLPPLSTWCQQRNIGGIYK